MAIFASGSSSMSSPRAPAPADISVSLSARSAQLTPREELLTPRSDMLTGRSEVGVSVEPVDMEGVDFEITSSGRDITPGHTPPEVLPGMGHTPRGNSRWPHPESNAPSAAWWAGDEEALQPTTAIEGSAMDVPLPSLPVSATVTRGGSSSARDAARDSEDNALEALRRSISERPRDRQGTSRRERNREPEAPSTPRLVDLVRGSLSSRGGAGPTA